MLPVSWVNGFRLRVDKFPKVIDLPCATAKSAKSKAFTLKGQMATSDKKGRTNYGYDKKNCAQDDTHRPQDGTESGTRYSQDGTQDGARYSQNRTEDGARYSQNRAEGRTC